MARKFSSIFLTLVLLGSLVLVAGFFAGFFLEPSNFDLIHQIVIWSFTSVAALCLLLMLSLSLEPEIRPKADTVGDADDVPGEVIDEFETDQDHESDVELAEQT